MLALKLSLFLLLIFNGVLSREIRRGSTRYRHTEDEYKYNHPPAPENYEAIPVAVVYEDESSREDKSIKNSVAPGNNIEQVNGEPHKLETSATKEPNDIEVVDNKPLDAKTSNALQEELKITTYRPQREQQIPVAVVYDPEPTYNQKPRPNNNRITNKRRKIQRPAPDEKLTEVEDTTTSNVQVNGHTGPIITSNRPRDFNKKQKIQRPLPEAKPTAFGNSDNSNIQNTDLPSTISTTSTTEKPDKWNNRQDIQQSAPEEKQAVQGDVNSNEEKENKYILLQANIPKVEKVEELNNRQKNRPMAAENTEVLEGDTNTQEYENTPSTPKIYLDSTQHYSRKGNTTRVREIVPIIQSENHVYGQSGNFRYSYEGGDGTKAFEQGELKTFEDEKTGEAVSGGFSYTAKDGKEYSLSYTADENGYRPVGAHLPTPPPIPPAIARALAHLATKTTPEPVTESIAEYDE